MRFYGHLHYGFCVARPIIVVESIIIILFFCKCMTDML